MLYVMLAAGFLMLFFGGEALIRGAASLAKRIGVSPLVIGLTVVGFGTSMPEMVVSVQASLVKQPDISVGNVVGSNIANILLILGVTAIISPLKCKPALLYRDSSIMVAATIFFVTISFWGTIGAATGVFMLASLAAFIFYTYWSEAKWNAPSAELRTQTADLAPQEYNIIFSMTLIVIGLGLLIAGSRFFVGGAVGLSRQWGVPEAIIGLTLVAVGTSLPELATSVLAAFRGQSDVAVGNIIGSNIFNILGILGVASIIAPIAVSSQIATFDNWVMLSVALLLCSFMFTGWKISRWEGAIFLVVYCVYIFILY
ncbi:MAG: calcium/sodium antiporter [Candidatus Hinthialibacter antarcticus]|nr:calcium/sodium antiporter [Candidatus Hinthialibacter antarcticus]